jgi:RimJ/RimL family protein N-acetyltransferase
MLNPFIKGKTIYLRAPEPGDQTCLARSVNHPAPREHLFFALPLSLEKYYDMIQNWADDHQTIVLTICTHQPDEPIGLAAFFRIDWVGRMATYYIAISDSKNWSKGYGKEVTQLMVDYAFTTLNLNRVQLHVSSENKRAIQTYEACGFQKEGTLRQAMYHMGHYVDFYLMSILRNDYSK